MAIPEACGVWIEQRIQEELDTKGETGASLREICRKVAGEVEKYFEEAKMDQKIKHLKFTTKEICGKVGIKSNTLHYYIEAGAIIPDVDESQGRGTQRLFSAVNLIEVAMVKRLISFGLLKKSIVLMLKSIRAKNERERLVSSLYAQDGINVFIAFAPDGSKGFEHRFAHEGEGTGPFKDSPFGSTSQFLPRDDVSMIFDITNTGLKYLAEHL
jgi:hypothetical protein